MSDIRIYYSAETGGFYRSDIHKVMPGDVALVTQAEHEALIAGQADGRMVRADGNGRPILVQPLPPDIDLATYAAAKRWAIETAGIVVNGASIATDRESQGLITGAFVYVQANPSATVQFKAADGFVTLDAAAVTTIANAVAAHVQACFAAERDVLAGIVAGTVTDPADIDAWAWPGA
ncbi:DUF4376 domain-containing protein [Ancylobacter oerskovii]|uniref:DUF4376 domain-containing protein n=1 Tax=Ancylobacter oerskovii TaxID=459519 RepID=A0ABW4Z3A5_9HYPH|nr:DUF4376 domain-containing protein [Ancylobacter oerskovii]